MRKKILITGSSGMLGIELLLLLRKDYDIAGVDTVEPKDPSIRCGDFIKCDITDRDAVFKAVRASKPDIVIHAAAWTDVDGCETDKDRAMGINAIGTQHVALACKENKALLFYISSDFVFDGTQNESYKEDDKVNPINVYGLSKLKGEESIRKTLENYFILRTSWLFGKNGRNFVDIILDKAERKRELKIVADQFGSPTYARDLCEAIRQLIVLYSKNKDLGGVFHFCNSGSCSWYRYAEEIIKIARKDGTRLLPITSLELDRPADRPSMSILDTTKFTKLCGESARDWQAALADYLINEQKVGTDHVSNIKK